LRNCVFSVIEALFKSMGSYVFSKVFLVFHGALIVQW